MDLLTVYNGLLDKASRLLDSARTQLKGPLWISDAH